MSKLNDIQSNPQTTNNLNCQDYMLCIANFLDADNLYILKKTLGNLSITKFLDLSALRCPKPLLQTKKELKSLKQNDILLVKTTDPSFQIDIKVFTNTTNNVILKVIENKNAHFTLLQKK